MTDSSELLITRVRHARAFGPVAVVALSTLAWPANALVLSSANGEGATAYGWWSTSNITNNEPSIPIPSVTPGPNAPVQITVTNDAVNALGISTGPSVSVATGQALPASPPAPGFLPIGTVTMNYYYEVTGAPNSTVPVQLSGIVSTVADVKENVYVGVAEAGISGSAPMAAGQRYIYLGSTAFYAATFSGSLGFASGPQSSTVPFDVLLSVPSGTPETLSLFVYARSDDGSGFVATVDPLLTIAPDFAASNPGFSLVTSEGIYNGPVASAPEPATWTTMLIGLAGLGFVGCRRRKKAALLAAARSQSGIEAERGLLRSDLMCLRRSLAGPARPWTPTR